jgi:hypothetical protein
VINKRWKLRRGVSITEAVVASFVFMIMLAGLVGMGVNAMNQWSFGSSKVMADNDAILALQALSRDVRGGIRATVDANGTTLSVVMPAVNSQGDYDRFTDGVTVNYYAQNGKLWRQSGVASATVLAKKINSATFAVSGSQIQIRTTSTQQYGTRSGNTTLTTQITLRNELTD